MSGAALASTLPEEEAQVLLDAADAAAPSRAFVLDLVTRFEALVRDGGEITFARALSSFQRMLVHRLADAFRLAHFSAPSPPQTAPSTPSPTSTAVVRCTMLRAVVVVLISYSS